MKKKRWVMMSAGIGIGAVMLVVSGFSAMTNTSGYDVYKAALKNNLSATSISNEGSIKVTDNGTEVLNSNILVKINGEQGRMSLAVTMGNGEEEHTLNVYKQQDKVIMKSSENEVYRQIQMGESKWQHHSKRSGPPEHVETVIDMLMGNMKEMATVENAQDGGKLASLHLSGGQIPTFVNVPLSLLVSNLANSEHWNGHEIAFGPHELNGITSKLPQLTENIIVEQIHLEGKINTDNYLERQTTEIVITGTDASGMEHELVIALDLNFSRFNQTVPDSIDLTGKPVETIQQEERGAPWHR